MFGVLLESKARRQRRTGGAVLSVASHMAIIGTVTAATMAGPHRLEPPSDPVPAVLVFPHRIEPQRTTESAPSRSSDNSLVSITRSLIDVFVPPTQIDIGIRPIEPATGAPLDSFFVGSVSRRPNGRGDDLTDGGDGPSVDTPLRGSELMMRVVTSSKPVYPERLRQAGIGGHVLATFTVDTLGRIDPASVRIVTSTHDLFSNAVRDALSRFRFKPSEVNGRRVSALAEMPFEFQVSR